MKKQQRVNIRISKGAYDVLKERAKKEDRTIVSMLNLILEV